MTRRNAGGSARNCWATGVFLVGIGFLAGGRQACLQAGEALPPIKKLVQRHIRAMGGEKVLSAFVTRHFQGEAMGDFLPQTGKLEYYAKAPNKRLSIVEIPQFGQVRSGFDGKRAWTYNPGMGVVEEKGELLERSKRDADFYRDLHLLKLYPDLKVVRADKAGGEPVWVAESRPTANTTRRFYFSQKTALLVREEAETKISGGVNRVRVDASDFRKVDGILFPFKMDIVTELPYQPPIKLAIRVRKVEHNIKIPDGMFEPPKSE